MDSIDIGRSIEEYKSYEITLCIRDKKGNPTGETKTFRSHNSGSISDFWETYKHKPKKSLKDNKPNKNRRRGKKAPAERIPDAKEANSILKTLYNRKKGSDQ